MYQYNISRNDPMRGEDYKIILSVREIKEVVEGNNVFYAPMNESKILGEFPFGQHIAKSDEYNKEAKPAIKMAIYCAYANYKYDFSPPIKFDDWCCDIIKSIL